MINLMFWKKKRENIEINKPIGIIEPTDCAIDNNTIDKFNKEIVIKEGVKVIGNKIIWGRTIERKPYSKEVLNSLVKIKEMAIVERRFTGTSFIEEQEIGGVVND